MPDKELWVQESDQVIEVSFNRPEHENGITVSMWQEFYAVLQDRKNKPLVVSGTGQTFSMGRAKSPKPTTAEEAHAALDIVGQVNTSLRNWPLPTIARVSGKAFGAALGLILHCDVAVADTGAKFCFPEILHGIAPTIVASYLGERVGYRQAVDLLLTGRNLTSQEAYHMGIVHYVVEPEELHGFVGNYVSHLASLDPEALAYTKRGLLELPQEPSTDRLSIGIDRVVAWQLRSK